MRCAWLKGHWGQILLAKPSPWCLMWGCSRACFLFTWNLQLLHGMYLQQVQSKDPGGSLKSTQFSDPQEFSLDIQSATRHRQLSLFLSTGRLSSGWQCSTVEFEIRWLMMNARSIRASQFGLRCLQIQYVCQKAQCPLLIWNSPVSVFL